MFFSVSKYLIATTLLLAIFSSHSAAAPRNVYNIVGEGNNHLYSQINANASAKYFTKLPTTIYKYWCANTPIRDTKHNRKIIILAVKPAYLNNSAHIDFKNIVKLPLRGWCIPSNLPAAFAIDFTIKNGFIHGFTVGSSIPCEYY